MSMIKRIEIDGKQVSFKASAAIPRIYRMKFQRDIYKDLKALEKSIGDNSEESSNLCLRISHLSWQNMQMQAFRTHRKSGWMDSTPFPFIRCFHSSLSFGD